MASEILTKPAADLYKVGVCDFASNKQFNIIYCGSKQLFVQDANKFNQITRYTLPEILHKYDFLDPEG